MPRQPRYFLPGFPQHVIQRGVDRQAVFFGPADYELYRHALAKSAEQCHCQVHAYVLMTNHTHLLITPWTRRSLPRLMQAMGRFYVQALNKKYKRTGPLWQGRYKASLVQDDLYLLTCQRYIELNPVRAGMVIAPGEYLYSSYARNAYGTEDDLITPHPIYESLAAEQWNRQAAYRQLFSTCIGPKQLEQLRATTNACLVLGNDRFKDQIEAVLGRSVRPGRGGRPRKSGC
jgi:putative transposase